MKTCAPLMRRSVQNSRKEARNSLIRDTRKYFDMLPRCDTCTSLCSSFFTG